MEIYLDFYVNVFKKLIMHGSEYYWMKGAVITTAQ